MAKQQSDRSAGQHMKRGLCASIVLKVRLCRPQYSRLVWVCCKCRLFMWIWYAGVVKGRNLCAGTARQAAIPACTGTDVDGNCCPVVYLRSTVPCIMTHSALVVLIDPIHTLLSTVQQHGRADIPICVVWWSACCSCLFGFAGKCVCASAVWWVDGFDPSLCHKGTVALRNPRSDMCCVVRREKLCNCNVFKPVQCNEAAAAVPTPPRWW
jgi:hypothetical protein